MTASLMKANVPSEPHKTEFRSISLSSVLRCLRSYPVRHRLSSGKPAAISSLFESWMSRRAFPIRYSAEFLGRSSSSASLITRALNSSPVSRTAFRLMTWSRVLPYLTDPWPLASVLTIPPIVARFDVDRSGAKKRPCLRISAFKWSFTAPHCTRAQRSSTLISRIAFICLLVSTTMPAPKLCALVPVPPPRG